MFNQKINHYNFDEDEYDEEDEEDEIDRLKNKKRFNKLYGDLSFSYGKNIPEDDDFQNKLK